MATNTYVALDKVTLGSDASSITFNSIDQGYTDLVIVMNTKANSAQDPKIRFNGDSSSLYSSTGMVGNGSSASSGRSTGTTGPLSEGVVNSTGNFNLNCIVQVMNYSNTTTNKSYLSRINNTAYGSAVVVGLYRSTSAITSITILINTGTMSAGSTFSLYGIAAASIGAKATGGTIYSDDTYYYHAFTSTGTFTPLQSLSADILVVAGGGGGGAGPGGGAGAGGLQAFTSQSLSATGYTCTVGSGGAGAASGGNAGSQGGNSQFGALTASIGGGYANSGGDGGTGGSGGGASPNGNGGAGTSGQGYAGGSVTVGGGGSYYMTASGGGAGAAGTTPSGGHCSDGGIGATSSFINAIGLVTGLGETVSSTTYFAGGGGGGNAAWNSGGYSEATPGLGGYGGGGDGANRAVTRDATSAVANMGGGGGGGAYYYNGSNNKGAGGNGGSGVIVVRYAK